MSGNNVFWSVVALLVVVYLVTVRLASPSLPAVAHAKTFLPADDIIRLGMAEIHEIYTDAEAVQVRNLKPSWAPSVYALCGDLRSKEPNGRYNDYRPFVVLLQDRPLVHVYVEITTPQRFAEVESQSCHYPQP